MGIYNIFIYTKLISLYSYFLEANLCCSFTSIWAKLFLKTTFFFYISIFLLLVLWEPHKHLETWIVELPHLICEFSIFCLLLLGLVILFARCGSAAAFSFSFVYFVSLPMIPLLTECLCSLSTNGSLPALNQSISENEIKDCVVITNILWQHISHSLIMKSYNKQFIYQAVCFF